MDDILLADSDADTLEEEVKRILSCWGLQIAPEKKNTKRDSIN